MTRTKVNLVLECGGGGAARHVLDLYHALKARGWSVRLVVSLARADRLFIEELRQVRPLDVARIDVKRYPHPSDLFALRELRHLTNPAGGFSIVHAHSTKAGMLARGLRGERVATLFTPHAFRGMDPEVSGLRRLALRQAERMIASTYDRVIAVSRAEFDYARALGLRAESLRHIPNGLDVQALLDQQPSAARRPPGPPYLIGFVGRLVHQKNPEAFLRIFGQLLQRGLDARAVVIGDGPRQPELERMCRAAGIADHVQFRGAINAAPLLGELDVLLHTSRYESLPYVLLEALGARVPVVAVDNAGSREILLADRLIGSADDVPAFVEQTRRLLLDEAFAQRVIDDGVRQLERYDIATMCRAIESEYEALLAAGSSPVHGELADIDPAPA